MLYEKVTREELDSSRGGNGFLKELLAAMPDLGSEQAMAWASAVVKHLVQNLDRAQREELAQCLPSGFAALVKEEDRIVGLFGKERPRDFFINVTEDAGVPPSQEGARHTVAAALAAIRRRIPETHAKEIERALPENIAELWRGADLN